MVAVRDIAALETILVEKAAASGPKLAHPAVCVECLASVDTRYSVLFIIIFHIFWLKKSQSLSVLPAKVCLEQSILIFLDQISIREQSEHSESIQ